MATGDILTVNEAKDFLNLSSLTEVQSTLLVAMVSAATGRMESYCQCNFISRSMTEYHEGRRKRIYLSSYPVVSVASITDPAAFTVPATDYIVKKERGILEHFGFFPQAQTVAGQPAQWVIVFTAGWWATIDLVPENVKVACKLLVSEMWDRRNPGISSVSVGGLSVGYSDVSAEAPMSGVVTALLQNYRHNNVLP